MQVNIGTDMNIKIAVCDDDPKQIEYLTALMTCWGRKNNYACTIASFSSAEAFLFTYSEDKTWDVLLLDIEMGTINGVELAKIIRPENEEVQIIFITGFPDFIADGYEVAALHYLMKPVLPEKLYHTLDRAVKNLKKNESFFLLKTDGEQIRLPLSSIFWLESEGHFVHFHTSDAAYTVRMSLSTAEKDLDNRFIRCHRTCIVNLTSVSRITKNDVILDDGTMLPLARNAYQTVTQAFIRYHKGDIS